MGIVIRIRSNDEGLLGNYEDVLKGNFGETTIILNRLVEFDEWYKNPTEVVKTLIGHAESEFKDRVVAIDVIPFASIVEILADIYLDLGVAILIPEFVTDKFYGGHIVYDDGLGNKVLKFKRYEEVEGVERSSDGKGRSYVRIRTHYLSA